MSQIAVFLSRLFGGGAWGVFLAGFAVIGALYLRMGHFEKKSERLEIEKAELEGEIEFKDEQILSQARSQARRTTAQKDLNDVEAIIAKQPESYECASSGAVRSAFSGLRKQSGSAETNPSE